MRINEKYKPLFVNDSRFFVITGGRGSSKSYSANTFLNLLTFEQGHKILFTRYTMTSADISIIPEFTSKMDVLGISDHFNVTKRDIRNNITGSEIMFRGIKTSSGTQTANLKSLEGLSTWVIDEAEEVPNEKIFDDISLSVRQDGVQNRIIIILNPTTKEHWIYKRFFEDAGVPAGFNGVKDDVTYIHTTYLDNIQYLDDSFIQSVERMKVRRPNKYKHTILGGWLERAEGVIFNNWSLGDFDTTLPEIYGQDYGYANDPSTLVKVAVDQGRKIIYLDECFYLQGQSTTQIVELNKKYAGSRLIVGDNAEPRLISELRQKGVNIKPSEKGPDSIRIGISRMLDYDIIVTSNSINLIKEFNNYAWNDKKSQTPIDNHNHLLDAVRYAMEVFTAPKRVAKKRNYIKL